MMGDFRKSFTYSEEGVRMMETRPEKLDDHPVYYLTALGTYMQRCLDLKEKNKLFASLDKGRKFLIKIQSIIPRNVFTVHRLSYYDFELQWYILSGEFQQGINFTEKKILPGLREGFKNTSYRLNAGIILPVYLNITRTYFGGGDYSTSLKWMNKTEQEFNPDMREDITGFIKLFTLILHFELGNFNLLEQATKSVYRFLRKKDRLYQTEKTLLDFINKKLPETYPGQDMRPVFTKLKQEFEKIFKDPYEKEAFEFFDFISWLTAKTEGRPFGDVVREKALRESSAP